ncbi:unnamed protein product [Soboliphyme baturini]|uniref:Transmembrane protein 41A n=1 Tax=Soboliphyme baturini TaxID=241478 RepID=A0A183ISA9_9BILA|nr:unnamed protein product [Soboliphyme baturini]
MTIMIYRAGPQVVLLLVIFSLSLSGLVLLYLNCPPLNASEKQYLRLPRCLHEAKLLGHVLVKYRTDHFYVVYGGMFLTYIFLQSFAIPGSIFLSVLSGYLFSFLSALLLICTVRQGDDDLAIFFTSCVMLI